jgi:anti-anti-sigma factor
MMISSVSSSQTSVRQRDCAPLLTRDGDRTVVWLEGDHDIATVFALGDALEKATADGAADVIVDLSGVTFIGAASVGVLLRGLDNLRRQSRSLTLRAPSRCARRVIEVFGLSGLVEARSTEPASK